MEPANLTQRQAIPDDEPLAFDIFEAAMRHYVDLTWGWHQDYQRRCHQEHFNPDHHQLAMSDGNPCGLICVETHPTHLQLVKLYLLPAFRNRGLGTLLLQSVIRQGRIENKPSRLRVLQVNQLAQAFYSRHGFKIIDESPERLYMEYSH
ncbi:GNAT family N-acetyltransferase [Chromobacterium violaceum]|uniref:GNAT family N-acetyltransferase n=1 Tax=Chromobacterium violaceum TaxID=536 RepID=UPI001CE19457|nr:GNAT family N-acetyltransferase [Chromobacterium violaceum]